MFLSIKLNPFVMNLKNTDFKIKIQKYLILFNSTNTSIPK